MSIYCGVSYKDLQ